MKIENVGPFGATALALFDSKFDVLKVFDTQFANPYRNTVLVPKIEAASEVVMTSGLLQEDMGYTKDRNAFMDACVNPLNELRYDVIQCRKHNDITDNLASFNISQVIKSITHHQIKSFQTNFEILIARVNLTGNKAALITQGFTQAKIDALVANHDAAVEIQKNKFNLERSITDLSWEDQLIVKACIDEVQNVLNGLQGYAKSIGDKKLQKAATYDAILKSVQPTPPPTPRNRNIDKGSSIVIFTDFAAKNILQLELLKDAKVCIYRSETKTGSPVDSLDLVYKHLWEGKLKNIPGTGRYIKAYNASTDKKALISVFKIVVKNLK